jgi:hypothetical protein
MLRNFWNKVFRNRKLISQIEIHSILYFWDGSEQAKKLLAIVFDVTKVDESKTLYFNEDGILPLGYYILEVPGLDRFYIVPPDRINEIISRPAFTYFIRDYVDSRHVN